MPSCAIPTPVSSPCRICTRPGSRPSQKKHSLKYAYEKVEDLLANKAVDAVYIAAPNKFHIPLTIQALKAGKHVMLEKPFAMNAAEAAKAIADAKKPGIVLISA